MTLHAHCAPALCCSPTLSLPHTHTHSLSLCLSLSLSSLFSLSVSHMLSSSRLVISSWRKRYAERCTTNMPTSIPLVGSCPDGYWFLSTPSTRWPTSSVAVDALSMYWLLLFLSASCVARVTVSLIRGYSCLGHQSFAHAARPIRTQAFDACTVA